jgi:uncharacterized protein YigA (DUF484 family)
MTDTRRTAPTDTDSRGSGSRGADAPPEAVRPVSGADVAAYLAAHPDYLIENPKVVDGLSLPSRTGEGNVVDMQHFMLQRLQGENTRLKGARDDLVTIARDNQSTQSQVHEAVLRIIQAQTFEHLIQVVTVDLAVLLDVDAVTICVETGDTPIPKAYASGIRALPKGTVEALLGIGKPVRLMAELEGDPELFGSAAGLVRSQALLRLEVSKQAPLGVLAVGSRRPDRFDPGQGVELIAFLARALSITIRQWLNLPK